MKGPKFAEKKQISLFPPEVFCTKLGKMKKENAAKILSRWVPIFLNLAKKLLKNNSRDRIHRLPSDVSALKKLKASGKYTDSTEKLYIVWDALGDGRVVGIFSSEEQVRKIMAVNPFYYRFYTCEPGKPTLSAIDWLDEESQKKLLQICSTNKQALRF